MHRITAGRDEGIAAAATSAIFAVAVAFRKATSDAVRRTRAIAALCSEQCSLAPRGPCNGSLPMLSRRVARRIRLGKPSAYSSVCSAQWAMPAVATIAVATFCLTSCVSYPQQWELSSRDIRPLPSVTPLPNSILGLSQRLATRPPGEPIRMLAVHGMLDQVPGFSDEWQNDIVAALGPKIRLHRANTMTIPIHRGYAFQVVDGSLVSRTISTPESQLRRTVWYVDSAPQHPALVVYELLWAPLRDVVKDKFFACFESRTLKRRDQCDPSESALRNTDSQYRLNDFVKNEVMVDGIADATIVLGGVGNVLQDDVDLAFCLVATDVLAQAGDSASYEIRNNTRCGLPQSITALKSHGLSIAAADAAPRTLRNTKLVVLTHSLGSFLVLNGQQRAAQHRQDSVKVADPYTLLDYGTVYMFANQISLLELARFSVECAASTPADLEDRICGDASRLRHGIKRSAVATLAQSLGTGTQYVAFNDANDLLGFEITPYLAQSALFGPVVNVSVRNPAERVWFFHAYKDPQKTHVGAWRNPAVARGIALGIPLTH